MTLRTLAIILGVALAISVGVNLFAATAAVTALRGQNEIARRLDEQGRDDRRASTRELVASLDEDTRRPVRRALREAGLRARPDFEQARALRRQAVQAASAEPFDRAAVEALLAQSRAAEARGRARLEADALSILETLEPEDRRRFADILNGRGPKRPSREKGPEAR